jgi:hypothetical protein
MRVRIETAECTSSDYLAMWAMGLAILAIALAL